MSLKSTAIKRGKKKLGKSQRPDSIARRIADYMWGTIIILRDPWCAFHRPIKEPATVGHHIFAKGECPSTRYNLKVGLPLCGGCHEFKAHSNPEAYRHIVIAYVGGQDAYDRLFYLAGMRDTSKPDYKLVELMLWQDLNEYKVYKPEGWDYWKEWKKEAWLRNIRRSK